MTSPSAIFQKHDGTRASRLRETVPLNDGAAKAQAQSVLGLLGEGRPARHHHADTAAHLLLEVTKYKAPRLGNLALVQLLIPSAEPLVDEKFLHATEIGDGIVNTRLEAVKHLWHANEQGGLQCPNVLRQFSRVALVETNAHAARCASRLDHALEDMSQRQVGEVGVGRAEAFDPFADGEESADQSTVEVHHTLGHSGGATGVHDDREVVRLGGRVRVGVVLAQFLQLLKSQHPDVLMFLGLFRRLLRDGVHAHNGLDRRAVSQDIEDSH
mmetsp:Transcript_14758/g.41981  ORF Transcript_14758/g.41981 Transcript_14758/m.41981 type:complete len:270 (-) Transcript_14758:737-1546(-)